MSMNIDRTVIAKVKKFEDVEVHVSAVTAQGETYAEIREYVPSLEQYGKGLTLPTSTLDAIMNALEQVPVTA